jgi:hypothetical protein
MPIMSLADWKSNTSLDEDEDKDNRSRLLRAVDDALEAYHKPKANKVARRGDLKKAFDTWLAGKKGSRKPRDAATIAAMQASLEEQPYRPPAANWTAPPIPQKPKDTSIYLARSFENANSLERDQSMKAFGAARELINKTYLRLNQAKVAGDEQDTYEHWFGTYDGTRYQTVLDNIRDIYDALYGRPVVLYYRGASAAVGPSDCPGDNDSSRPEDFFGATWNKKALEARYKKGLNKEYTHVFLGEEFYSTVTEFNDSMAGVVIHELSHAICGTEDVTIVIDNKSYDAYGVDLCHRLASSRPEDAIKNADNYEFLCEAYWSKLWTPTKPNLNLPPKAHIKIPMRAPG